MASRPDPRREIARLYRGLDGSESSEREDQLARDHHSSTVYGELLPGSVEKLIQALRLRPRDVFYDFGSGIGKVVLQVAMSEEIERCVGIELLRSRQAIARRVLGRATREGLIRAQHCELWTGDFMTQQVEDATVVYACSTAYSKALMDRLSEKLATLPEGLRFVCLSELLEPSSFELSEVLYLDTSWKLHHPVRIYQLPTRARAGRRKSRGRTA